jgi:acyl-coenzyme A synthetase/AMP-(fatty) acid ligase
VIDIDYDRLTEKHAPLLGRIEQLEAGEGVAFNTSGTTGGAKRIVHASVSLVINASSFVNVSGMSDQTVMFNCLDPKHMGSFLNGVMCPWLAGGTIYVAESFSPFTFWDDIRRSGANTVWLSPTMVSMLLRAHRGSSEHKAIARDLCSVFCGFSALPRGMKDRWLDTFSIPLRESYGTTESLLVAVQSHEDAVHRYGPGTAIPLTTVSTRDAGDGRSELMVNSAGSEAHVIYDDGRKLPLERIQGRVPTGDEGYVDAYGYIHITGRIAEFIKRGGGMVSNVAIRALEEAAQLLDGVRDAVVVGVPDDTLGEAIGLCIVCDNDDITASRKKSIIADSLALRPAGGLRADVCKVFPSFPTTPNGKVLKRELREKFGDAC